MSPARSALDIALCGLQNEQVCSFHLLNRPQCFVVSRILVFERSKRTRNMKDEGALGVCFKPFRHEPGSECAWYRLVRLAKCTSLLFSSAQSPSISCSFEDSSFRAL
jgi:hypothetical protein